MDPSTTTKSRAPTARVKEVKAPGPAVALPPCDWRGDSNKLTWELITQMEKKDNRQVFWGKESKEEVSLTDYRPISCLAHRLCRTPRASRRPRSRHGLPMRSSPTLLSQTTRRRPTELTQRLIGTCFPLLSCGRLLRPCSPRHRLFKNFKKHAKRLRKKTGEGLREGEAEGGMDGGGEEYYYIPANGPNASTPEHVMNLWRACL
jgi:hypothetical protein